MMKLLPTLAVLVALLGTAALAGWQSASVPGTPRDLQVQDAGHVVLSTTSGAYDLFFTPDGGVRDAGAVVITGVVGAWHDYDAGRLGVLRTGGAFSWNTGGSSLLPGSGYTGMRHTAASTAYALAISSGTTNFSTYEPTGGRAGSWQSLGENEPNDLFHGAGRMPLSALRVGAADYLLFGDDVTGKLLLAIDAGIELAFQRAQPSLDAWLYREGANPGALVVVGDGGLEQVTNIADPAAVFRPLRLPAGVRARAAAFSVEEGDGFGRGFGVASAAVGASGAIVRAVPNPAQPGGQWLESIAAPAGVMRVACVGAEFCAVLVDAAPPNNLLLYWNQFPPVVPAMAPVVVNDTELGTLVADAGDPDGDPVYVTWLPADAGYPLYLESPDFDGKRALITPDAGAFCGQSVDRSFQFRVLASDGRAAAVTEGSATLIVHHLPSIGSPGVSPVSATVVQGASPVRLTAASAPTGCPPTAYSWTERTDAGLRLEQDGGEAWVHYPPTQACSPTSTNAVIEVRAFDGPFPSAPTLAQVLVSWPGGGVPLAPTVSASALVTRAGGPPQEVRAAAADAGCLPDRLVFTELTPGGSITWDGSSAVFSPPEFLCSATAQTYRYELRAQNGFDASVPTQVSFTVEPWGAPYAPVMSSPVSQTAGVAQSYRSAGAGHFCAAAPVVLEFQGDAGPQVQLSSAGPELRIEPVDCQDTQFEVQLRHRVLDAGSEWVGLQVNVQTVLEPILDGGFRMVGGGYQPGEGQYRGELQVEANCPSRRALLAELSLSREDGALEATSMAEVPGPFNLAVPGGCNGGRFTLAARLLQDGGFTGHQAGEAFQTARQPARVGEISRDTLEARCMEGAGALLQMLPPAQGDYCQAQGLHWEQVAGPALSAPLLQGNPVTLQTVELGYDELIGREVTLRLAADAGVGNGAHAEKRLTIVANPFVSVRHRTDSPVADEAGIATLSVVLTNNSGCPIRQASYEEQLDGLRFVQDSARFAGEKVSARVQDGVLKVEGLELPAWASRELVYAARPPLLGRPAPSGTAWLRGIPISESGQGLGSPNRGPPPGCGCTGAPSGLGGLLLLWALVRTRSRPAGAASRPGAPPEAPAPRRRRARPGPPARTGRSR